MIALYEILFGCVINANLIIVLLEIYNNTFKE